MKKGEIHLNFENAAPAELIQYSVSLLKEQFHDKAIDLVINAPANLPQISADKEKFIWLLINVISNAIRYTPRWGNITISAEHKKHSIIFSISDSGPGMKKEHLTRIFDSLIKFSQHQDNAPLGLGLGLAIAKEIVQAHGGKIWAESELGNGSRFFIEVDAVS